MIARESILSRREARRRALGYTQAEIPWTWPSLPVWAGLALLILPWTPATRVANPGYITAFVFVNTPQYLFTLFGLLILGGWIASRDGWLGLGSLYVTLAAFWHPSDLALATAHWVALGAAGVVLMRSVGDDTRAWIIRGVLASCVLEVVYTVLQMTHRDLLFFGLTPMDMVAPVGTLGNPKYLGAMLALAAPFSPLWLLPVFIVGIFLSKSALAAAALLLALVVKYGVRTRLAALLWALPVAVMALLVVSDVPWYRGSSLDSLWSRLGTWHLSLAAWWWHGPLSWIFGSGFGTWFVDVPKLQVQIGVNPAEVFFQGHSEPIQLLYEGGLAALVIVGGWVLHHWWDLWDSDALPSLVALGVLCAGLHVFHTPTLAPTGLLVVALATWKSPRTT